MRDLDAECFKLQRRFPALKLTLSQILHVTRNTMWLGIFRKKNITAVFKQIIYRGIVTILVIVCSERAYDCHIKRISRFTVYISFQNHLNATSQRFKLFQYQLHPKLDPSTTSTHSPGKHSVIWEFCGGVSARLS